MSDNKGGFAIGCEVNAPSFINYSICFATFPNVIYSANNCLIFSQHWKATKSSWTLSLFLHKRIFKFILQTVLIRLRHSTIVYGDFHCIVPLLKGHLQRLCLLATYIWWVGCLCWLNLNKDCAQCQALLMENGVLCMFRLKFGKDRYLNSLSIPRYPTLFVWYCFTFLKLDILVLAAWIKQILPFIRLKIRIFCRIIFKIISNGIRRFQNFAVLISKDCDV